MKIWLKLIGFVFWCLGCGVLACVVPAVLCGIYWFIGPVDEITKVILAAVLLMTGMGPFIFSLILVFGLWIAGVHGFLEEL